MNRRGYEWCHETMAWVPVQRDWRRHLHQGLDLGMVLAVASILAAGLGELNTTPQELSLLAENRGLRSEVTDATDRLGVIEERLGALESRDQDIYRVMLQTDEIPSAVRQVGVGGSDPMDAYSGYSTSAAELLLSMESELSEVERRIRLQSQSTRELVHLATAFEARTKELPSIRPVKGRLTSKFGNRIHPIYKRERHHPGVDFTVPTGTPIHATADGVISKVSYVDYGYGIHVEISHPAAGYKTLYAHLSGTPEGLAVGQRVERGQVIGLSGNTGLSVAPHLHYEVRQMNGAAINPLRFLAIDMDVAEWHAVVDGALD